MTGITEETAINILDELMQINAQLTEIIRHMKGDKPASPPIQPPPTHQDTTDDTTPPPVTELDYTPVISEGGGSGKGEKYMFIGRPEFDITKDVPPCYKERKFDSPECLEKKGDCVYAKNCEELTIRDKDRIPKEPPEETKTPKQQEIEELGQRIKDLKEE